MPQPRGARDEGRAVGGDGVSARRLREPASGHARLPRPLRRDRGVRRASLGPEMEISNSESAAIGRARRLARRLLSRGWAVMVVEPWATGNEERHVPSDEALAVLSRSEPWEPSQEMFSLVATDSGQDLYRMHSLRRPLHRVGFNH